MNRAHVTLLWAALLLVACGPAHIAGYTPKRRNYTLPEPSAQSREEPSPGSLFRPGRPASMLFTDARALQENDLVVVKVEEVADAKRSADTSLDKNTKMSAEVAAFLEQVGVSVEGRGSIGTGRTFKGEGSTARTERLTATVPAIVRKVLPNGNLFIEGHRVVLVNSEEQHFYISGLIRPIDIDQDNSVKSSAIADAEIEFTGRGVLSENQEQGLFTRLFGWLWPF